MRRCEPAIPHRRLLTKVATHSPPEAHGAGKPAGWGREDDTIRKGLLDPAAEASAQNERPDDDRAGDGEQQKERGEEGKAVNKERGGHFGS